MNGHHSVLDRGQNSAYRFVLLFYFFLPGMVRKLLNPGIDVLNQKKTILKSAVFFIFLVIILSCAEFFCSRLEKNYLLDTDLYRQEAKPLLHRTSSVIGLGYELIPGAETEDGFFSINSAGFRGREYALKKASGVLRIAVVGDSVTFGTEYPLQKTYPKVLEAILNAGVAKPRVEVFNAGVCAYNAVQKTVFFKERIARFSPDILIFQFLNDDYYKSAVVLPSAEKRPSGDFPVSIGDFFALNFPRIMPLPAAADRFLLRHSSFYRVANKTIYDVLSRIDPDKYIPSAYRFSGMADMEESMTVNKKAILDLCAWTKKRGIRTVFLLVPELSNEDKTDPWIKTTLPQLTGVGIIDLYRAFKSRGIDLTSLRIVPEGRTHFNEQGHRLTAMIIADWLRREGLVPADNLK